MQWLIAAVHAAPYSKGSEDSDAHPDQAAVRTTLLPVLEAAGLDLLLSGHSHSYERSFLIRGHHGSSDTWNTTSMCVSSHRWRYNKRASGLVPNSGFVAVVTGSAGKLRPHLGLNHPANVPFDGVDAGSSEGGGGTVDNELDSRLRGVYEVGSTIVHADDRRLRVRFVNANGDVRDDFVITKPRL